MQVMNGSEIASPTAPYLFQPPVPMPAVHNQQPIAMVPAAIEVEVREEDGSWSAYSPLLGVAALADTEADLYGEFAEQLSDFWDILNEQFATLSDDMRRLLDLRGQSLDFVRR